MEIPSTWTFQENIYGANVMLFSPDNGDEIKENLGVSVQKLGSGDDLQTLYTNNKTTLQNNFENLAIKDEKDLTINEIPAKEISYTFSQGDYKIKQAQYLLINEKKAYIFTYVALTKTFDEYSEDVESIINSFLAK
ncbi:TPA: hypothetical protein DEP21_02500 [Patescibacteria group bacterium]|nr:hypothetical protein [Candidatus Gracilibacteria bacterium]